MVVHICGEATLMSVGRPLDVTQLQSVHACRTCGNLFKSPFVKTIV